MVGPRRRGARGTNRIDDDLSWDRLSSEVANRSSCLHGVRELAGTLDHFGRWLAFEVKRNGVVGRHRRTIAMVGVVGRCEKRNEPFETRVTPIRSPSEYLQKSVRPSDPVGIGFTYGV